LKNLPVFSYISFVKEVTPSKEMKIVTKNIYMKRKNLRLLSVLKLLDPDPYEIYGSGSRRGNNIQIQLDPDQNPQPQ